MRIKIPSKEDMWYFIMLFSIFKPGYLPYSFLIYLYYGVEAITLGYLGIVTIKKKILNYKLIGLFAAYYAVLAFSTLLNSGDLIGVIEEALTSTLVILWFHIMIQRNPKSCLTMLMIIFQFLIYTNLVTIILYPNGLYRTVESVWDARFGWFLGHQSLLAMYVGPAICIAVMYFQNNKSIKKRLISIVLIVACVTEVIILGSANNIICVIGIFIGTIIMTLFRMTRFSYIPVYFTVAGFVVIISVLQITTFMEPFVVMYLHRTATFTDRTFVWARFIRKISDRWILGNGLQKDELMMQQLRAAHAHNQYLQCLFLGGIVLFIIFCLIYFNAFKNLQLFAGSLSGRVIISATCVLMMQMIFDSYFHHTMGKVLIVLSYYFGKLFVGSLGHTSLTDKKYSRGYYR